MVKKLSETIWIFIIIAIAFTAGFFVNEKLNESIYKELYTVDNLDLSLLANIWGRINNKFVNQDEIDKEKLTYGAVRGMVEALDDPYSTFYDPDEAEIFKMGLEGSFEGVGIQMGEKDDQIVVISPIKNTPAEKAGIMSGDIITKVNDEPIYNLSIDKIVSKIRGESGTEVILGIKREGEKETDYKIIRDEIKLPTTELAFVKTESDNNIAHLSIFHFSETTYNDFQKLATNILEENTDGIILDLRSNPGGLVNEAKKIASWFLEKGDVIVIQEDKDGNRQNLVSSGPSNLNHYPLVILINEGTASASEILTGALNDHLDDTIIVGKKSFGKGLVQEVNFLPDDSILKITTNKWYTPNNNLINKVGISPDIEEELTLEDYKNGLDPQLEVAIQEIDKIIK